MSRLDWKEGGRFDRIREGNSIDHALRGFQNAEIEAYFSYFRFWPAQSQHHAVYDEAAGTGLVYHPEVVLPALHVTHGEGPNEDTEGGFYFVDDLYVSTSFEQVARAGLTELDVRHEGYLRDRIVYDGLVFRVTAMHVTGQVTAHDFTIGIECTQIKPDEYILDPQFVGLAVAAGVVVPEVPPPD